MIFTITICEPHIRQCCNIEIESGINNAHERINGSLFMCSFCYQYRILYALLLFHIVLIAFHVPLLSSIHPHSQQTVVLVGYFYNFGLIEYCAWMWKNSAIVFVYKHCNTIIVCMYKTRTT